MKMSTNTPIIDVRNIKKIYKLYDRKIDRLKENLHLTKKDKHKDFIALRDISFSVEKGETIGIIGTNGSGKSTLLKLLTNVVAPTDGTIEVNGKISALLELGAGFNPEYTGIKNIYLNGSLMGFEKEEMDKKIDPIIEFADIGEFIYQPVKNYSSGMFARLAFAVAINVEPDVLIVDEALSVGDIFFQNKCYRKFEELKRNGVTIIFVSHDIESVKMMCNRTLWIEKGEQIMYGDSKSVCNAYSASILRKNNKQAISNGKIDNKYEVSELSIDRYPQILNYGKESILSKSIEIKAFFFEDELGNITYNIVGGQKCKVVIVFKTYERLENIITGFILQNKKGEILVNTNSLVCGEKSVFFVEPNKVYRTDYEFIMPCFRTDEYILDCAVAQGTNVNDSKMLTWLYGALHLYIENNLGNLGMIDFDSEVTVFVGK